MSIDEKLLACIMLHKKDTRIEEFNSVFMYVKNYCHYSAEAAKLASQICQRVAVLDVLTNRYVDPLNLKQPGSIPNTQYIQAYKPLSGLTVPQIHLYNGEWKYIGGCSDFKKYLTGLDKAQNVDSIRTMFQGVKF
jgi:glutaredoxin